MVAAVSAGQAFGVTAQANEEKPPWWGNGSWPAVGQDMPDRQYAARHANRIPLQVCYDSTPRDADGILIFNSNNCYPSQS